MPQRLRRHIRVSKFACLAMVAITSPAWAQATGENLSIESLLTAGWQISGYAGATDNRSAFILFRRPEESYLVQCRAGYDATREPHIQIHCYKL